MMNRKTSNSYFLKLRILSSLLLLLISFAAFSQDKSAYDIWNEMTEAGLNFNKTQTLVEGAEGVTKLDADGNEIKNAGKMVMFGGEKEGSSSLITRIMGPNKQGFKSWVDGMPNKDAFLKTFLSDFASGKIRVKDVRDAKGALVPFDLTGFKGVNFQSLSSGDLAAKFDLFLALGGDKSFSHISKPTRIKMFNGSYGGLTRETGLKKSVYYGNFTALHGEAEKFIDAAHGTSVGWEINFNPQRSYGEFEYMIDWFKNELKNVGQKFEAPGHQWIVYPKSKAVIENADEAAKTIGKLGEIEKNIQAYIVLKGIEGGAGIELANHKTVHTDQSLISRHSTGRGVVRLENERFNIDGQKAFALEFRAGVKSDNIRRMHQKFLVSRYAANEYDDLADGKSWTLVGGEPGTYGVSITKEELIKRFNVSPLEASEFLNAINNSSISKTKAGYTSQKKISHEYLAPLWKWENAPYISSGKKEELRALTKTYIKTVANLKNPDINSVRLAMQEWVKTSQVTHDIENYLKPKQKFKNLAEAHVYPMKMGADVDVNDIDMGIEYSARYPLKSNAQFIEVPGQKGKYEWQKTHYGYNGAERKAVIENFAKRLGQELNNGKAVPVHHLQSDGHGHGLDIAYELRDENGKKWRVEWDGIGRSYDTDAKMVDGSVRGGHVEIVTPKFVPNADQMQKLYTAMEKESLIPSTRFGGGHINIDLAPFEGKPKQMARFLGAYLDNRDVMSMMFQHAGRQVGAEPVKVSQAVINKLKNFDGTEKELKQLLYNEKFFNTRVGRKTKNNQLNILAYIQDVIPEELIHSDFDMKNDMWRRTFDVDPKIRKMEFRLFNAPRNAQESALQIKFTKALLNKALNETDEVFTTTGKVDYNALVNDPKMAFAKFEKTMKNLGLDSKEYKGFMLEGLETSKHIFESSDFLPLEQKLKAHPEIAEWGQAVEPRTTPIGSEGRKWAGDDILPEAKVYKQQQMLAREFVEGQRDVNLKGRLDRGLEKMPMEVNLSFDEIKKLNDNDALVALYYQKTKLKVESEPHNKFLKEIFAKDSFKNDLPRILHESLNTSPGFQKFIVDGIPDKYSKTHADSYVNAYKSLLESPDAGVRGKAISYLSKHPQNFEALLSKADAFGDKNLIKEVIAAAKDFKVTDENIGALNRLESIIAKTDDPASVRGILTLAKQMEPESQKSLYTGLLEHNSPQIQGIAHNHMRSNFEKDYYFYAKDKLAIKDYSPESKKVFGKFLNETKVFDNLSSKELFALPKERILPFAMKIVEDPSTNGMKRQAILKELAKEENLSLFQKQLASNSDDADLMKWAYKNYTSSEFVDIKDARNVLISGGLLQSQNSAVSDLGFDLLDKIDTKEARKMVLTSTLDLGATDGVKSKIYSKILDEPKLLGEVSKYDYSGMSAILGSVEDDIKAAGSNRVNAARVLSNLSAEGNASASDMLASLAKSPDKKVRNVGLVLYGNANTKETHKLLPHFFNDKPLEAPHLKLIQNGIEKHDNFIKNLSAKDLKKKTLNDKLWFLYKHDSLAEKANVLDIAEILKDEPDALKVMNGLLQESNVVGKNDPYAKWLVSLSASPGFKEIADADITTLKEIAYNGLNSPDEAVRNEAIKLLKSQEISPMEFISSNSKFNFSNDAFVQNVLSKVEMSPSDLAKIKDNSNFHNKLLSGLRSAPDAKSKTILAQVIRKIPGSTMDKTILDYAKYNPSKQFSVVVKGRKSNYAFDTMVILSNHKDPVIKANALAGIQEFMKNSRELESLGDLDTKEALALIYHKSNNAKGKLDVSSYLKQIKNKDEILPYLKEVMQESNPDRYRKWVLGLLEDPKNIEALEFKRKDVYAVIESALEYSSPDVEKATLQLIRKDKLVTIPEKVKLISDGKMTEDSIDTLKMLAAKNPKSEFYEKAIGKVFEQNWHSSASPAVKRKTAELMMMMPTGVVENVIKKKKANYGNSGDDIYLMLGGAKHNSPVVADLAKENLESSDRVIKKTATRIADKWEEKSVAGKAVSRAKCAGRSIRNVLNRLTFR